MQRRHRDIWAKLFDWSEKNYTTKAVERHNKPALDGWDELHGLEFWSPDGRMDPLD